MANRDDERKSRIATGSRNLHGRLFIFTRRDADGCTASRPTIIPVDSVNLHCPAPINSRLSFNPLMLLPVS
jgi:hypothetical protein